MFTKPIQCLDKYSDTTDSNGEQDLGKSLAGEDLEEKAKVGFKSEENYQICNENNTDREGSVPGGGDYCNGGSGELWD